MGFTRVVEVLPPLFPHSSTPVDRIALDAEHRRFVAEVDMIRNFADVILVANVKTPSLLKVDTVNVAAMLQERLGVEAAPVIVTRDQNRPQFLSTVLSAISLRLRSVMIAWGDDYPASAKATNVRDFEDLARALREASSIRTRARSEIRFFAPVDVNSLAYPKGVALAKARLRAGADLLLAQPPTTDAGRTFDTHASLLESAGLRERVLLGVFPFEGKKDVTHYERLFGWRLPKDLHREASQGKGHLNQLGKDVVRRLRKEGYPGVYLVTRGNPSIAETYLS